MQLPNIFWVFLLFAGYIAFGLPMVIARRLWLRRYMEITDPSEPAERVSSRIREVLDGMREAAKDADSLVTEMAGIAAARAREVKELEAALGRSPRLGLLDLHLKRVLDEMREAAKDADSLVTVVTRIAAARARSVEKLEAALSQMETKNSQLEAKFKTMAKAPPAALDQLAAMLADRDRRNTRRDRRFFVAGMLVSAVVTLVITAEFR